MPSAFGEWGGDVEWSDLAEGIAEVTDAARAQAEVVRNQTSAMERWERQARRAELP